ncbi:MAG: glycosyltransferase family 1 protein [Chitinophagaceae bacterium]
MNIGFDAKRYFHNTTGLGNYSRTLIEGLATYYPQHQYYLLNPKPSDKYAKWASENVHEVLPSSFLHKKFSAAWRSSWVKNDLQKLGIDLYHGLSHEIPLGIQKTGIRSVVTMHDLISERYPEQFSSIDVSLYRKKYLNACEHATRIIAISQQTKRDLIDLYKIDEDKIDVCYQSCNPVFAQKIDEESKEVIRKKYDLPNEFFLSVGSIIERKNLLNIVKALQLLDSNIPLVVIGEGGAYKEKVKAYITQHSLQSKIIFLSEQGAVKEDKSFQSPQTFAAIYQMAIAMIYPSFFEGFGIPVLEALWSKLPVITSNVSCLPEIAIGMKRIYEEKQLCNELIEKGWQHAQNFTLQKCTDSVMNVYQKIVQ